MDSTSRRFPLPSISSINLLAETIKGSRATKLRNQRSIAEAVNEAHEEDLAEATAPLEGNPTEPASTLPLRGGYLPNAYMVVLEDDSFHTYCFLEVGKRVCIHKETRII